jgi:hypothetical protein
MRRSVLALLCFVPAVALGQAYVLRAPSMGEAFRTMDALANRPAKPLDQVFVLPERPGQNQVAWYDFNWQYVDVPPPGGGPGGIRLYYYKTEVAQARRALPAIQSAYARLVDQFHYSPTKRIPYILFATQREFQTQNVFQVTEGVLGVTSPEDLKMSVPYFGDHSRFIEVSTHEMVHQFTIQKLLEAAGAQDVSSPINFLPLWFIEGIAEYYSKGGIDTETDVYLRDLVWNPDPRKGYDILPFAEDRLRGYIPTYKLGQARIAFIADVYGKEKIQAFLENAFLLRDGDSRGSAQASGRNFGALTRRVLNEPIEQVDGRWRSWLKRRYYPEYLKAKQDLPQLREIRGLPYEAESFAASPDGNILVVRGIDRNRGRARLFLADARNPRAAKEIAADSVPGFESLHPIDHSIAAVGEGLVVFAAQSGFGDAVYAQTFKHEVREKRLPRITLGRRRTVDIRPPDGGRFIQIADPALSPDLKQLAFVGVARDGQQDVYVVPVGGGVARRLTNDYYTERDLSWGAEGIYCASDATDHGRTNLFRIDPATGARTRLTTAAASDRYPRPLEDGSILYSSNIGGKNDLYVLKQGQTQQITDFTTGLMAPALAPGGRGVFATTFHGGTFRLVEIPKVAWLEGTPAPIPPAVGEALPIPVTDLPLDIVEYDALSIKNWRPEAGYVFGGGGGSTVVGRAAALFSDMLRDRVLFVDLSVYGSFDYSQGLVLYEDRSSRIGWIGGGFHFVQQNIDPRHRDVLGRPDVAFLQRDFGIVGALRYPLDRFRRFELELTLGGTQRFCPGFYLGSIVTSCGLYDPVIDTTTGSIVDVVLDPYDREWRDRNSGTVFNTQPAVRYGYDTIRYDYATGPLAGNSFMLELGGGYLPQRSAVHGFAHFDTQQYFQIAGRANIGFRAALGTSFAPNERSRNWERTWWLSSADNLRGFTPFDIAYLVGRNYYVANAELQFPLDPLLRLLIFDYIEGVAALDFGGVFDEWGRSSASGNRDAWDHRTLTGVLGANVLFGPLLLRVHFGHPFRIGGIETQAMIDGTRWVTNVTLRYFFF